MTILIEGSSPVHSPLFRSVDCHCLAVLSSNLGFCFRDSCESYSESYPDVSNKNIFAYEFRKYHMSFVQNKHIKLEEIWIDTQDRVKEKLSNVMDVLPLNVSKHNTLPIHTKITHSSTLHTLE